MPFFVITRLLLEISNYHFLISVPSHERRSEEGGASQISTALNGYIFLKNNLFSFLNSNSFFFSMKKSLSLVVLLLLTATASFAGEEISSSKKMVVPADDSRFHKNEWQIDSSTVGAAGVYKGQGKQALGGNLGVNYFFTKYLGIGIDNSVGSIRNAGLSGFSGLQGGYSLQADLLLRYPIAAWNLAPYLMVGGGASWGPSSQGDGNVGGGVEWRLLPHVGFFADCRWLYGDQGLSVALPRVGLRLSF